LAAFLQAQQLQQQQGVHAAVAAAPQQLPGSRCSSSDGMRFVALQSDDSMGSSSSGGSSGGGVGGGSRARRSSGSAGTGVFSPGSWERSAAPANYSSSNTLMAIPPPPPPAAAGSYGCGGGQSLLQHTSRVAPLPAAGSAAAAACSASGAVLPMHGGGRTSVAHHPQQQQQQQRLARAPDNSRHSTDQPVRCRLTTAARRSLDQLRSSSSRQSKSCGSSCNSTPCRDSSTPLARDSSRPGPPAAAAHAASTAAAAARPPAVVYAPAPPTSARPEGAVPCAAPGWATEGWDPKAAVQQAIEVGGKKGTGAFIPPGCMLSDGAPAEGVIGDNDTDRDQDA
jgi:hypothetical protein